MMDGVPSKVNVLLQVVSYPGLMFFSQKVSNPGHGTKVARGLDGYTGYQSAIIMILQSTHRYSSTGAARINPGHSTKVARGLDGYTGYQSAIIMILQSTHRYSSTGGRKDKSWSRHQNWQEDRTGTLTGNVN